MVVRKLPALILSAGLSLVHAGSESLGTLLRCEGTGMCLWADSNGNAVDARTMIRELMASDDLDYSTHFEFRQRLEDHVEYIEDVHRHALELDHQFAYKMGVNHRHLYEDDYHHQTAREFVEQELVAKKQRRLQEAQQNDQLTDFAPLGASNSAATPAPAPSDLPSTSSLPSSLNWCTTDNPLGFSVCSSVKSQENCGSCWAFAAADAIEGAVAISSNAPAVSLSPQQFLDCSTRQMTATFEYCWIDGAGARGAAWLQSRMKWGSFNNGCNGGMTHGAFADAAQLRMNLLSQLELPYQDASGAHGYNPSATRKESATCQPDESRAAASIESWEQAVGKDCEESSDSTQLLKAALQQQPISVAINSGSTFKDYKGGVYECPDNGVMMDSSSIDHALVLVGYGSDDGDYWILKNSYGPAWGDKGFVKLRTDNKINCGVSVFPVIPTGAAAGPVSMTIDGGGKAEFLGMPFDMWLTTGIIVGVGTVLLTFIGLCWTLSRRRAMRTR